MKQVIAVIALAAACFFGYKFFIQKSPAYGLYLEWDGLILKGDCDRLRTAASGSDALAWVEDYCRSVGGKSSALLAAEMYASPANARRRVTYELKSEVLNTDGSVDLVVMVRTTGALRDGVPWPPARDRMRCRNVFGIWKVDSFSREAVLPGR